ncbi:MAG: DUF4163 domain-containing protein [Lachnospiraceae bacterium]|nr:DUF4163 domain-containing protein [Lachnospiraceae bacterium]
MKRRKLMTTTLAAVLTAFMCISAPVAADDQTASEPDVTTESVAESVAESTAEVIQASGAPVVCTTVINRYEWSDDYSKYSIECEMPFIRLTPESAKQYPKLADKLDSMNKKSEKQLEKKYGELEKELESMMEQTDDPRIPLTYINKYYVQRSDAHILSILGVYTTYLGGAHGMYGYTGVNLDSATGKAIKLSHIVKDKDAFIEQLKTNLLSEYPDIDREVFDEYFSDIKLKKLTWTAGCDGITCYFEPYTLGAYAIGAPRAMVPFAGNESIFSEEITDAPESYGVQLPLAEQMYVAGHSVTVYGEMSEYADYKSFTVVVDGEKAVSDNHMAFNATGTYLHSGEGDYIYLDCFEDNDYHTILVFKVNEGAAPELVGESSMGADYVYDLNKEERYGYVAFTDPYCMPMTVRVWLLSTVSGDENFRVGSDGMPVDSNGYYDIYSNILLTLKKDVTFDTVGADGTPSGTADYKAGTTFSMIRTDNAGWVDLAADDGSIARVNVEANEWPQKVNGEDASELFDGMFFAG